MSWLISLIAALLSASILCLVAGENPFFVAKVIWVGSFGSPQGLGYTIFYATPLLFTGLAVALPLRLGFFNIGAEGQLYLGAIGLSFGFLAIPQLGIFGGVFFGLLFAAVWALIPMALRLFRNIHEVISTILLNFVALALSNYLILHVWRDDQTQRLETPVFDPAVFLPRLGLGESPANLCFFFGVLVCLMSWIILKYTDWGLQIRSLGSSRLVFNRLGGNSIALSLMVFALGGMLSLGAAANDLLGASHRFRDSFSLAYGFTGIAVAFVARAHPLAVIPSALFFGALTKGAMDLDLETETLTRDFSFLLQGLFILMISIEPYFAKKWKVLQLKFSPSRKKPSEDAHVG